MKRGYQRNAAVMRKCKYPNIAAYMAEHDMSVRMLAQMCGMHYPTLYNTLIGCSQPRAKSIHKILRATGMSHETAFGCCADEGD